MRNKRLITYFARSRKICYQLNSGFAEFPRRVLKIPKFLITRYLLCWNHIPTAKWVYLHIRFKTSGL